MTPSGVFVRAFPGPALPQGLLSGLPDLLWLPEVPEECTRLEKIPDANVLLYVSHNSPEQQRFPLIFVAESGRIQVLLDVERAIQGILLESYHGGLRTTAEMRLPFNYSLLPSWVKGLARAVRGPVNFRACELNFPSRKLPAVVDWLYELHSLCEADGSLSGSRHVWPGGKRAAVVVTHDVDTDWLFRNPDWLERFCDAEESAGLKGAWYCVPQWSNNRHSERGMQRLLDRGCELGCHGFNHDAKWPLCSERESARRLRLVRKFRDAWDMRGFRSEWLWRTPEFLEMLSAVFQYDSSVPTFSEVFTSPMGNGCGTVFPYRTHGNLLELPLTLPMDEDVHRFGGSIVEFWDGQVRRAEEIINCGGLVVLSFHPQPHQAANDLTLVAATAAMRKICAVPDLWLTRPDELAAWVAGNERLQRNAGKRIPWEQGP